MTLTPAQSGFLKGLLIVVITAVASFFASEANLSPLVGNSAAVLIAGLASSFESYLRAQSGKGLFGAVTVR